MYVYVHVCEFINSVGTGFIWSVRIRKDTMFFSDGQEMSGNDHEWSGNGQEMMFCLHI